MKLIYFCSDETVGRQMLIYLAQYLLDNYDVLPEITHLVDTTDIWLMPSMNPDGYAKSKVRNNRRCLYCVGCGCFLFYDECCVCVYIFFLLFILKPSKCVLCGMRVLCSCLNFICLAHFYANIFVYWIFCYWINWHIFCQSQGKQIRPYVSQFCFECLFGCCDNFVAVISGFRQNIHRRHVFKNICLRYLFYFVQTRL